MKNFVGIIFAILLFNSVSYAKPIEYFKNENYILFKEKRGLIETKKKLMKSLNYVGSESYDHCKSIGKDSYFFLGLTNGTQGLEKGLVSWDMDERKVTYTLYRGICAQDLISALKIFQEIKQNYVSRLDSTPYKYIINHKEKIEINENDYASLKASIDQEKKITEKPKEKQKPKASPDDNKIVPAGSGSGFFVSKDGHAITNYHVIEGCDINKLSFKGSQTEVKVLAVDKVNDIAILKSNAKPDVIFPVSNEDVSLLEDVIVAGFPLGKQISSAIKTHKGVVTALAGAGDNYSFFQTDAAINQGNSGGPIINQKGNVVGVAVATWVEEGVQGVHFGIKSSTLKTFASANGLSFASPNYRELSNKDLGKLITKGTVYVECHMTVAKIKKMIAQAENRKAFFKEHK